MRGVASTLVSTARPPAPAGAEWRLGPASSMHANMGRSICRCRDERGRLHSWLPVHIYIGSWPTRRHPCPGTTPLSVIDV